MHLLNENFLYNQVISEFSVMGTSIRIKATPLVADALGPFGTQSIFVEQYRFQQTKAWTEWPTFGRWNFRIHFPESLNFAWNFTKVCFKAPNRWQAITWTNDDPVHWHLYVSLSLNEFMKQITGLLILHGWFTNIVISFLCLKILRPDQNGPHSTDNTAFSWMKFNIWVQISPKFVPKGFICQYLGIGSGNNPFPEQIRTQTHDAIWYGIIRPQRVNSLTPTEL